VFAVSPRAVRYDETEEFGFETGASCESDGKEDSHRKEKEGSQTANAVFFERMTITMSFY